MVFNVKKELTGGSQSRCELVRRLTDENGKPDNRLFVCKTQKYASEKRRPTEERILSDILPRHHRLIDINIIFRNGGSKPNTQLFFEYCGLGDLNEFTYRYAQRKERLPESFIWHAFLHLSEALAFIHYGYGEPEDVQVRWTPVIHRDIKPGNVFMKSNPAGPDEYPQLVLGDFGLGITLTDPDYDPTCWAGTNAYQPPERERASRKSDVWAMGATLYSCCHKGATPIDSVPSWWQDGGYRTQQEWRESREGQKWLESSQARQPAPLPSTYSYILQNLLNGTLRKDPAARYSSWDLASKVAVVAREERRRCYTPLKYLPSSG
jgi:serine/threonine protein kinase